MAAGAARTWDFQGDAVGSAAPGFSFGRAGEGREGKWVIAQDSSVPSGENVLAQVDPDDADYRFPVAVADGLSLKDLRVEMRCTPANQKTDQACGLVFRHQDRDRYYVARTNALEDHLNLYRVVKGRPGQIKGWNCKVAGNAWHTLAIEARGDRLRVLREGQAIVEATDDTFTEAGRAGVSTKTDSVTPFAALAATPLP